MKKGQQKRRLKKPKPYFLKSRKRWVGKVFIGDGQYRTKTFRTKTEAYDFINELWENRRVGVDGRETVAEARLKWLSLGEWKVKTREEYEEISKKFFDLFDIPLDTLQSEHVQQVLDGIKSTAMRKRVRKVLNVLMNWCVRRKMLRSNPVQQTESVKHSRAKVEVFTKKEMDAIIKGAEGRWKLAIELLLLLACRPGELWGLRWGDWKLTELTFSRNVKEVRGRQVIETTKTAAGTRTLPLPKRVIEILNDLRVDAMTEGRASKEQPVFPSDRGAIVRHSNFRTKVWVPTLKAAKVDYRKPYTIRHTAATWMLNNDVSLAVVSRWLGHESIETTLKHYSHLMVGELATVGEFWNRRA